MRTFAFLFVALLPRLAGAWGDLGHAVVGEVADRKIKETTKHAIEEILGPGPLSAAAMWPDQVRFDHRFKKFDGLHYFEVPPGKTLGDFSASDLERPSAYAVLKQFPTLVKAKFPNEQSRRKALQIALRYIMHMAGDVHQPLHTGNGIDQGGNLCRTELKDRFGGTRITNLHTLWDEDILGYMKALERERLVNEAEETARAENRTAAPPPKRYFEAVDLAGILERELPEFRLPGLLAAVQRVDVGAWIEESVSLRRTEIYPDAEAGFAPPPGEYPDKLRPYCGKEPAMVVKLDDRYLDSKTKFIQRQLMKAGLRLAALLDQIFSDTAMTDEPPSEELIKMISPEGVEVYPGR